MSRGDSDLVRRAKEGDPTAFSEIYEKYYPKIFSYVRFRVATQETAEDIASDAFVRLVKKIDTYEHRGKPILAWLYTVAGNLVRDHHRRAGRVQWMPIEERELVSESDPTSDIERMLASDKLVEAISKLTDEQAQVVIHKFVEGRSNAEIAEIMDKQEGSIKSLQHRALRSLRRHLGDGADI